MSEEEIRTAIALYQKLSEFEQESFILQVILGAVSLGMLSWVAVDTWNILKRQK